MNDKILFNIFNMPKLRYAPFLLKCPMPVVLHALSRALPATILPAPIDMLYGRTIGTRNSGTQHRVQNMALIKFVFGKFVYFWKFYKMFIFFTTITSIDIKPHVGFSGSRCISVPNFVKIRQSIAELLQFFFSFSRWGPSATLDLFGTY